MSDDETPQADKPQTPPMQLSVNPKSDHFDVSVLERGVGIRIFDRTGGTVRTTAGGALFLARARQLIAQGSGAFCTLSYSDKELALLRCRWTRHEGTQADTIIKVVKSKLPH